MPRAARVCPIQGCIELVTGNARYCEEHERARQRKVYSERKHERVDYGPDWPAIREEFLEHNPQCSSPGCPRRATEVDHIVPYRVSRSHDWSNLQGFCKPHHSQKTAREDGGFGNARR